MALTKTLTRLLSTCLMSPRPPLTNLWPSGLTSCHHLSERSSLSLNASEPRSSDAEKKKITFKNAEYEANEDCVNSKHFKRRERHRERACVKKKQTMTGCGVTKIQGSKKCDTSFFSSECFVKASPSTKQRTQN